MITRFSRQKDDGYYNMFQLGVLFISEEVLEILKFFNAYDQVQDIYHFRIIFWLVAGLIGMAGMCLLIAFTCIRFLTGA